jgi:hypothetical protein
MMFSAFCCLRRAANIELARVKGLLGAQVAQALQAGQATLAMLAAQAEVRIVFHPWPGTVLQVLKGMHSCPAGEGC